LLQHAGRGIDADDLDPLDALAERIYYGPSRSTGSAAKIEKQDGLLRTGNTFGERMGRSSELAVIGGFRDTIL